MAKTEDNSATRDADEAAVEVLESPARPPLSRRRKVLVAVVAVLALLGAGLVAGGWYYESVPMPVSLALKESTTIYYADGTTVLARLGEQTRFVIDTRKLPRHVTGAVLAAEDRDFRSGSLLHRPSVIARQYARLVSESPPGGSARLAVLALKIERRYGKDELLDRYLNAVYFGRGAYGIEAAARAYFGKPAADLTAAEAAVLGDVIRSPGSGAYDPDRHLEAAKRRWEYVRRGMVDPLGVVSRADGARMTFPTSVTRYQSAAEASQIGLDLPTGLVAQHVLSELRQYPPFRNLSKDALLNGGYRIVSTIDPAKQHALERAADATVAGSVMSGEPESLQAAAVVVEPKTGRVLAYYGGHSGGGLDYAGWYPSDEFGGSRGSAHPPGGSFAPYVLAAALHKGISVTSMWSAPASQQFRQSGRTSRNPVTDTRRCLTGADVCSLADSVASELRIPMYAATELIAAPRVIEAARDAGIDAMRSDDNVRRSLRGVNPATLAPKYFSTEIGIGQYAVTVLDQANGMATFAARGSRSPAHFVDSVDHHGSRVFTNAPELTDMALSPAQLDDLTWAMSRTPAGKLPDGRPSASATGSWELPAASVVDAWIVGFTPQVGMAVWVGNKGEQRPLKDRAGRDVSGSTLPAAIYRQVLTEALAGTPAGAFNPPQFVGDTRGDPSLR